MGDLDEGMDMSLLGYKGTLNSNRPGCRAVKVITDTGRVNSAYQPIMQGTATCAGRIIQIEQVNDVFFGTGERPVSIRENLENLVAGMCLGSECPNFVPPTEQDLGINGQFPSMQ